VVEQLSARLPEDVLWDFLRGALMTRALAIAADLGIAGSLVDGPRRVDELARETGADPDRLRRVLRALASDGMFEEVEPGLFANTGASAMLAGADGWGDFAHLFGGIWYRAVGALETTAGAPAFQRVFGAEFWSWLAEHPDERAAFDRAMVQNWQVRAERLSTIEWRGDETVVDVGGGNGSMLLALLQQQPRLRGIVLDLPETVRDEAALAEHRIAFVAGSFFEGVPAGDVYLLSTILHDWDDEPAAAILRTLHAGAPDHARLIVIDAVVEPGNEPDGAKWLDLLLLATFAGRERDEAQWRALLDETGWEPVRLTDGLIEARRR
jgi:O-methyltransferase domain